MSRAMVSELVNFIKPPNDWELPVGCVIRHKTDCVDSVILFAQKMADMKTVVYGYTGITKMDDGTQVCGIKLMTKGELMLNWEVIHE